MMHYAMDMSRRETRVVVRGIIIPDHCIHIGPPDSVAARCTHKAGGGGCKTVRVRGLRL